ncbi:MAG: hypothetical protein MI921_19695 [Cytophagales bacterium]|nr:hypothetical protein [Cytophagales bacterium]
MPKPKGDFIEKLADDMLAEKKCCPFLQFDLSIQANNTGVWKISGSPRAKEMIKSMVEKDE